MELSQVSKARKKKRNNRTGLQAKVAAGAAEGKSPVKLAEEVTGAPQHVPHVPHAPQVPHAPVNMEPPHVPHLALPQHEELLTARPKPRLRLGTKIALGTAATGLGAGGLYAYQRSRAKRSLSQMQPEQQPMMMRSR